jgi:diguanylate cyclase (GGDEF)-like protein
MWNVSEDSFKWLGDLKTIFGDDINDYPRSIKEFNNLVDIRHVPERLAMIFEILEMSDFENPSFSISYHIVREGMGSLAVEEKATLYIDKNTGDKILLANINLPAAKKKTEAAQCNRSEFDRMAMQSNNDVHQGRLKLQNRIEAWFASYELRQQRIPESFSFLLTVGIDRLSIINENFGASYTDEIIEATGDKLRKIAGENASVFRIDGDVFGVFFNASMQNEMSVIAQHIVNSFQNTSMETVKGDVSVSVSVGGITINNTHDDPGSIITNAEMAMNIAKDLGRGRFVIYEEASKRVKERKQLLNTGSEFIRALRNNMVKLAFQPVVDSVTKKVSFHETLIRFLDEDGKVRVAADFVPAIEKLGISHVLDRYAMKMAIQELCQFHDLSLSVNVSGQTFMDRNWLRSMVSTLRNRPSVADRLIVEITETMIIDDLYECSRVVNALQDMGCRIALDDFGTGYTAFNQLKELSVDIVKIDKSFVRNIENNQNQIFVKTLQTLANALDVETVGEGAETLADAEILAAEGVSHIQGYIYGYPSLERLWLPKNHVGRQISFGRKNSNISSCGMSISGQNTSPVLN